MQTFAVCSKVSNRELTCRPQVATEVRQSLLHRLSRQLVCHLERNQWVLLKVSEEHRCDYANDQTELRTLIDIGDIRYVSSGQHTFIAKPLIETRIRYIKEQLTLAEMLVQLPTAIAGVFGLNKSQFYRIVLLLVAT